MHFRTNDALRMLAEKVEPTKAEIAAAERHFQTIRTRLEFAFDAKRFIRIGSHARNTAIKSHSDIDFLAVLPRKAAQWGSNLIAPQTFLVKVANDLKDRYTTTSVRRDGQAIVLNFAGGDQAVDVVPGIFEGMHDSRPMYLIPGGGDDWISTSPESHDLIFDEANRRSGGKLAGVGRLIKAWKYGRERPIPISSFFVDMLLASSDIAAGVKSYSQCLYSFFRLLAQRKGRGLQDPAQIGGIVAAAGTAATLEQLNSAVLTAYQRADAAMRAEVRSYYSEANRQWSYIFNRGI
jgi:hypothetical protein